MRGQPVSELDAITAETLDAIRKAQTTGITSATGAWGYDLSAAVISLQPVESTFRNLISRQPAPVGSPAYHWRVMLNINNQQPDAAVAFDYAGAEVLQSLFNVSASYKPLALAGVVTRDAVTLGKNFDNPRARMALAVLHQSLISEDINSLGAQNFVLGTPAQPTIATSTTGGSIPLSTAVPVKVRARTLKNYFYGGGTVLSTQGSQTTGAGTSTNSAVASTAAVRGAVAYDWFVNGFYYTTTTTTSVTITAIPVADAAVPALPLIWGTAPTAASAASDTSASANNMNGYMATLAGDYVDDGGMVAAGSGVSSGATFVDNGGNTLTGSSAGITEIDSFLLALYQNARLSPRALMMNAQQALDISVKVMGSNAAVTFLGPNEEAQRANIVAGGYVGRVLNKATGGTPVRIEVHPHVPPGTIVARSDAVPYPGANIDSVLEIRTLQDFMDIPYAANRIAGQAGGGPREEFEIRSVETFVNRAPVAHGVLHNVKNG
jgi:hypothetical protein